MLAHGEALKLKKKPLPSNLRYESPHKRKREKGKEAGKWMYMLKLSPKLVEQSVNDSSLKEASS